ncbi:MAG: hypothetical protein HC819_22975 [Cyclobacteriaceae bacterium]|nr:hypothetical protein [Cyclobacteriaceae bacterium]
MEHFFVEIDHYLLVDFGHLMLDGSGRAASIYTCELLVFSDLSRIFEAKIIDMNSFMSFLKKLAIVLLLLGIGVLVFLHLANYSSGFRAGVPTKLSKKGILIKTFEGTLNVGGLTNSSEGAIPTTWDFTIKISADSVVDKLDKAILLGDRVKLMYHEKYIRFFWLGDTKYFVYDVEVLGNKND